jgi:DNA-binding NtrC family response regulator
VRELRNVISAHHSRRSVPEPRTAPSLLNEALPQHQPQVAGAGTTVEEPNADLMTLEHTRDNKTRAAEILGISLKTLHNKLNKLRLRPKRPDEN